ncbi:CRE-NCBP-1 protein [Caenorhabditis remanei]|uniref:Nuclear cap-binding protein subunit 1 n=1 Tax=Caenorhabditis remanei TaxID=31234 RepID=E3NEH5_CAERE|nr:CRE-NCBP-1 protein [Caenorhabditis remanei]
MSRRRQNDDEDETQTKRRRGAPLISDVEKKLQEVIGKVGEKVCTNSRTLETKISKSQSTGSSITMNLEKLTEFLTDDLDKYRTSIIDIVAGCAIYLPNRVTVYTTLVGLLNAKNFNFGGEVVEKLIAEQQDLLTKQKYQEAQNVAIFLCDLGNSGVLTAQSIGEYLESFISAAFEENMPQVRNDYYIQTVLRCLPWIGKELTEKSPEQMENIVEAVGKYLELRNKNHVTLLQVWSSTDQEQEDYLESLSAQIEQLRALNWTENHIPRYYKDFEAILADALQHNLPSFASPDHTSDMIYPYPLVVFRLFQDSDCSSFSDKPLPGGHSIDRFLFEGEISWIIEKNQFNRKSCARELLAFAEENPSVPIGFLIFETIFGQMLRLPHAPYPAIFHCSLVLELLKLKPDDYPSILVQTVEVIYRRADSMQPICLDRMVDWFSFHLSNFQYRYTWPDWKDCLTKDAYSGSQIFLREVIEKCRRLGSYEKIIAALPSDFVKIHPCSPDVRYLIDEEDTALVQRAETFTQMFQERQPAEAFLNELKSAEGSEELPYNINEFGLFVMVMLKMASKTFSHNFSALFRYQATLKTVCDASEQYQEKLLETLFSCWKSNQQMLMILTDKLLKMQVIDCSAVVAWLFDEKMWAEHNRQWLFEVLNQALEKLTRQINVVEKDIKELTERVENKGTDDVKEEEMEAEEEKNEKLKQDVDDLENHKEKLERMVTFQKGLFNDFLIAFVEEIKIAGANTSEMDGSGDTAGRQSPKFQWLKGRFCHVLLAHAETLLKHSSSIAEEVFTEGADPSVTECFNQFQSLRF